jgi:hypothetical protein
MTNGQVIQQDREAFRRHFNRKSYSFKHDLGGHELFDLERLIGLAQRVAERRNSWGPHGDAYWDLGDKKVDSSPHTGPRAMTIASAVEKIGTSQAWIFVKHVEREPGYRELLERCMCDCLELSGREVFRKIKWFEAIVFITSPKRLTPYHIDRECSWLLQIAGQKQLHVFDPDDRVVTPEEELEAYWRGKKRGQYKPELEHRATVYQLVPGEGVHIPVNAPHWIENGDNVSISLNVNFQFKESELGDLYRANYFLRRLGIAPRQPGQGAWRDRCKSALVGLAYSTKRFQSRSLATEMREEKRRIQRLMESRAL